MISNRMLLLTLVEKSQISAITPMAPANAPAITAIKPDTDHAPAVMVPPEASITSATPKPAPLLMPKIDGSARGLRKAV